MRTLPTFLVSLLVALAAGCGGGGGGTAAPAPTSTSASSNAVAAPAENVVAISVEPGPANGVNLPFASVTVCAPGGATCQTIDHVIVDTASSGLRVIASVLAAPLAAALVQQNDASGNPVVECAQFASGSSWGPVKIADVTIAGLKAASVPVQVIGDAAFPTVPAACSSTGTTHNTVQTLLGNGILGVGMFREDCGSNCAASASSGFYYACASSSSCQATALPVAKQVQNPAALFASDNNGVVVQLPAVPSSGATTASGALVFGIGTRSNNGLGNATVLTVSSTGTFTAVYAGRTLNRSFVDSGSNALFFTDTSIPRCSQSSFYCPAATLNLSATMQGANGAVATVNFSIANTNALLAANPSGSAFNNIGGTIASNFAFDFGLPFFYGRSVYTAFSGASTPAGAGPYIAF